MSDIEPKGPETPTSKLGVATTPNPPTVLTVRFDEAKGTFSYSQPGGNLGIVRRKDDVESFPLHLERGSNQDWEFVSWTSRPKTNEPVFTPSGKLVLEVEYERADRIRVIDRVAYDDENTYTYKYSFAIKLANGQTKIEDPEIQNRREFGISH